ncbi:MAG: ferredoxin [archaeon]
MAYRIEVDKEKCVGCGACVASCENFELGDEGKSHAIKAEVDEIGCNQAAADACPVEAITVTEI